MLRQKGLDGDSAQAKPPGQGVLSKQQQACVIDPCQQRVMSFGITCFAISAFDKMVGELRA